MYLLTRHSSDPKVTGIKKGGAQAYIVFENMIEQDVIEYRKFLYPSTEKDRINNFYLLPNIKLDNLKLDKKAKITDVLDTAGKCINSLIISEHLYTIFNVLDVKYSLIDKVNVGNHTYFYVYFFPINIDKYNFKKSVFYEGTSVNKFFNKDINYIIIENFKDFLEKKEEFFIISCEKIFIENFSSDIFFDAISKNFFISQNLFEILKKENITGLNILQEYEPIILQK